MLTKAQAQRRELLLNWIEMNKSSGEWIDNGRTDKDHWNLATHYVKAVQPQSPFEGHRIEETE